MVTRQSLKEARKTAVELPRDAAAAAEEAALDAARKLGEGRDRLGEATADAVSGLRDEADELIHVVRKRGRRVRKRARKGLRAIRGRWSAPAIAVSVAVAVSAVLAGAVKARGPLSAALAAGGERVTRAAKRVRQG